MTDTSLEAMARLDYVLIPTDWYYRPEIRRLVRDHGAGAAHLLLRLLLAIGASRNAQLDQNDALMYAADLGLLPDDAGLIIDTLLSNSLISLTNGFLTAESIADDQRQLHRKRESFKILKRRQRESRGTPPGIRVDLTTEELNTDPDPETEPRTERRIPRVPMAPRPARANGHPPTRVSEWASFKDQNGRVFVRPPNK